MKTNDYLKIEELEFGKIYKIQARNFDIGVWDGVKGFIGVRTKFNSEFLFTEIHYDLDRCYGTVIPLEKIGEVPEGVEIKCGYADDKFYYNNKELQSFLKDFEKASS